MSGDLDFDKLLDGLDELDNMIDNNDFDDINVDDLEKFQQDDILKKVLSEGIDLRSYARQIEQDLYTAEEDTVNQYLAEAEELALLHLNFKDCNLTLERMQNMLTGFQSHLSVLTGEIRGLRDETMNLNVKLSNRKLIEHSLTEIITNIELEPSLISKIDDAPIDMSYIESLKIFADKLSFCGQYKDYVCIHEVNANMDRHKNKATFKIKEFFIQRFLILFSQREKLIITQQSLLAYQYLYDFCSQFSTDIARELRHDYRAKVSALYQSNIVEYITNITKLKSQDEITRDILMGIEDMKASGFFAIGSKDIDEINKVFAIGARDHVLQNADVSPINPIQTYDHGIKLSFEVIFRSLLRLLLDFSVPEYRFVIGFFNNKKFFQSVMELSCDAVFNLLSKWLETTGDIIGVVILLRIVNWIQNIMVHLRESDCLDLFFEKLQKTIWVKFQQLFDVNLSSISQAKFSNSVLTAHYVTVRYATFVTAIRCISRSSGPDWEAGPSDLKILHKPLIEKEVNNNLLRLRNEVCNLLARINKSIAHNKKQTIFLINNYDFILMNLKERGVVACDEMTFFSSEIEKYLNAFVAEELTEKFNLVDNFISKTETAFGLINSKNTNYEHLDSEEKKTQLVKAEAKLDAGHVENIVKKFASSWQESLQSIISFVLTSFSASNRSGVENARAQLTTQMVVQKCLVQFLAFVGRFDQLIYLYFNVPNVVSSMVSIDKIKFQVRKYHSGNQTVTAM